MGVRTKSPCAFFYGKKIIVFLSSTFYLFYIFANSIKINKFIYEKVFISSMRFDVIECFDCAKECPH